MLRVKDQDIHHYSYMFENYTYNIPVIYSSLEGQYAGELYENKYNDPDYALLFTPFDFHYAAGNPDTAGVVEDLNRLIFEEYIPAHGKEEAVAFSPSMRWNEILSNVFSRHNGVNDIRKSSY